MANDFRSSLTAAAIKLGSRVLKPACVTCHAQSKLLWFRKNRACPSELFVLNALHHDTDAFSLSFATTSSSLSRVRRESGSRWFYGHEAHLPDVQSQSIRLPDATVLSLISLVS
jgi:hypothetical protein